MNQHKQPTNPLLYWWNEFLFARYFEYETDLTPEEIEANLNAIAHSRQGWMWGLEKTAKVTLHPNQKGLDFDMQSRRRRLFDPIGITTSRSLGTAKVDSGTGQTLVRGDVKLGRFFHIFLLIYVMMLLGVYLPLMVGEFAEIGGMGAVIGVTMPMLFIAGIFGLLWWRIYRDRNELAELMEAAVYGEKAKRAGMRLSENDEVDAQIYPDDEKLRRNMNKPL